MKPNIQNRLRNAHSAWAEERWHGIQNNTGHIVRIEIPIRDYLFQYSSGPLDGGKSSPDISPRDSFRIASIAKTFTAICVLRLYEDGRLSLDDKIADYLSEDVWEHIHILNGHNHAREITIRQLLQHTSGLFDLVHISGFRERISENPDKDWQWPELIEFAVKGGKPLFAPGQGQSYTDTGYVLLGLMLIAIRGEGLANIYRDLVSGPLGLNKTYLEIREPASAGTTLSHNFLGDWDIGHINCSYDTWGAGGMVSTADDLACLIQAIFNNKIFKNDATNDCLFDSPPPEIQRYDAAKIYDFKSGIYSLTVGDHQLWGHTGFWGSFAYYEPSLDLILTGSRNQGVPEEKQVDVFGDLLRRTAQAL